MDTDLSMDDLMQTMQDFASSITFTDPLPDPEEDPDDGDPEFDDDEPVAKDDTFYPRVP